MAYTHKKLRWWYGVFFAFSFSAGTFFYCIGPFLTVQRGFSQVMLSIFFASFGGALMVCQLVILPWISRRYAESGILMLALVGIALLYVGMLVPLHVSILMMLGMLYGAMYGLIAANTLGLLSKQTSPDQQGVVLGCATSVFMLGQLLPFIMASALAVPFGVGAPLVFATVLSCGLCVVYVCGFFEVGKGVASRLVPHQNGHPRASS